VKGFKIIASFKMPDGVTAIATMPAPLDASEYFTILKLGVMGWYISLPAGRHSISVNSTVPRRDDIYRRLLEDICQCWNADPDLKALSTVHVEVSLNNRGDGWVGCSTAIDELDKRSGQREMHFLDYSRLIQELEARQQALEEEARKKRRENPVLTPVDLPRNITSEIARYLRLEYGEIYGEKGSIKARDLKFEGEFVIDGVPTQYWSYPTSTKSGVAWATVERFDDTYCLGMTETPPPLKERQ
jgi:hypothetical protein